MAAEISDNSERSVDERFGTKVVRLTPKVPAAVAVIQIQGKEAEAMLAHHWIPNRGSQVLLLDRIRYGFWVSRTGGQRKPLHETPNEDLASIDEIRESVVLCRTEEETFEIHCHGGQAAADRIISDLVRLGAQNGALAAHDFPPSIETEAMEDLVYARTKNVAAILLDQMRGALRSEILQLLSLLELQKRDLAVEKFEQLLAYFDLGKHLLRPWRVVIAGAPNAGKSSLINRLLGYERTLVHALPGTTRDAIEEAASIGGWPVILTDTAGLRETEDPIEREGVAIAGRAIGDADLVLELVAPGPRQQIPPLPEAKRLLVLTKSDLRQEWSLVPTDRKGIVLSSLTGEGIDELMQAIEKGIIPTKWCPGQGIPFRDRHHQRLDAARESLLVDDLPTARAILQQLAS